MPANMILPVSCGQPVVRRLLVIASQVIGLLSEPQHGCFGLTVATMLGLIL